VSGFKALQGLAEEKPATLKSVRDDEQLFMHGNGDPVRMHRSLT
jgi:hypothetical protein